MRYLKNGEELKQRRRELRRNQTDSEKLFWSHVRNRQLMGLRFLRQYSIGPYILDFYCPERKIAVELDGGQHAQDESLEYDAFRTEYLNLQGISVLRFWNNEVMADIDSVLSRLAVVAGKQEAEE